MPENTLAAFRLGAQHGYRMFECDVKLSADGVPFLLHDETLERTTSGHGHAAALPWTTYTDPELAQVGLTEAQAMRHVILPQAVRRVAPPLLNDFVALQKDVALLSILGIIGIYLGKTFDETKKRPLYVVGRATFDARDID